jgi:hypothetical protein
VLQQKQQQHRWANFAPETTLQLVSVVASATVFVTSGFRTFDQTLPLLFGSYFVPAAKLR